MHSFIHVIHSFIHSTIHSFIHWSLHSFIRLLTLPFMHSFIHLIIHSCCLGRRDETKHFKKHSKSIQNSREARKKSTSIQTYSKSIQQALSRHAVDTYPPAQPSDRPCPRAQPREALDRLWTRRGHAVDTLWTRHGHAVDTLWTRSGHALDTL